jgi:predicted lysophospholipase L1 biosynthesis ABC-type transport system permease subunit
VAIVNETLARTFWPGGDPLGRRLRPMGTDADPGQMITVVGVAKDSTYVAVGEPPRPFLYRPFAQAYQARPSVLVRSTGSPRDASATLRAAVGRLDPGLALYNVGTMADANAITLLPARVAGRLLAGLGLVALALAALGIYGVLAYLVRARTREIGVRVAIGARPGQVARLVVRQALSWTLAGAVLGFALAMILTQLLSGLLYGISPLDPWTLGGVAVLLLLVAGLAASLPAWRASRLDPLVALRQI